MIYCKLVKILQSSSKYLSESISIKKMRIKIYWVTKGFDTIRDSCMFGYDTANRNLRSYCQKIMDFNQNADIAITFQMANCYQPIPDKFNILFTMWETADLPERFITGINRADAIVVPSTFCKEVFQRYTDKPVAVCPLGIEPRVFNYHRRIVPDLITNKFRFLWLGAPTQRKGWIFLEEIVKFMNNHPKFEMYIKTSTSVLPCQFPLKRLANKMVPLLSGSMKTSHHEPLSQLSEIFQERNPFFLKLANNWKHPHSITRFGKQGNVIVDLRRLSLKRLAQIYTDAHCFIFPTCGEGFGLTLCEALATGCPSIATCVPGIRDFFNEIVGYPIEHEKREVFLDVYDLYTEEYIPSIQDLLCKMIYVSENYQEALEKASRASQYIRQEFTWQKSAFCLEKLIRGFISRD